MSVAPSDGVGSAAAAAETGSELGGALGIAVFGSLLAAVYRLEIERALPANLPAGLSDRMPEGVGLAAAALSHIDGVQGASLRLASIDAYTAGFIAVAVVSAAVAVLAATIANRLRSNPDAGA